MGGIQINDRYICPEATVIFSRHARKRTAERKIWRRHWREIAEDLATMWPNTRGPQKVIACNLYEVAADFCENRQIRVITLIYIGKQEAIE